MKLAFLYHPVENLKDALTFYRETLGFEEAWREGEHTVAFQLPDSDIQLMIETDEQHLSAGGMFIVDSVDEFFNDKKGSLEFIKGPKDIPPGRYAICKDNSGNLLRIIDLTNEK